MTKIINRTLLDRFSDQPVVQNSLIKIYLEIAPETIKKLNAAVANGDLEQVVFHAHSLKGSSSELGAERMADLSQQLQMAAKSGEKDSIAPLAENLSRCYQDTTDALLGFEVR